MGGPKEGLMLADGQPMIAHVLKPLSEVCVRIVVVGVCQSASLPPDILQLPDLHPGRGPLGGLETLLASGLDTGYLVVACDQPFLTPGLLRLLLGEDATLPRLFEPSDPRPDRKPGVRVDPFPGYFPTRLLRRIKAAMASSDTSMQHLIGSLAHSKTPVSWASLPASLRSGLKSINTPDDLRTLSPLLR
jgi:molybdopterin-guanine dinucleotide biosynthesis protein A